ncbi:hypothetical protein ACHAXS_004736 [Conticribra weissflogii]
MTGKEGKETPETANDSETLPIRDDASEEWEGVCPSSWRGRGIGGGSTFRRSPCRGCSRVCACVSACVCACVCACLQLHLGLCGKWKPRRRGWLDEGRRGCVGRFERSFGTMSSSLSSQ